MFRILILINSLSIHNKTFVYYPDFFPIPGLPMKPLYALCVPVYALIICNIVTCGCGDFQYSQGCWKYGVRIAGSDETYVNGEIVK